MSCTWGTRLVPSGEEPRGRRGAWDPEWSPPEPLPKRWQSALGLRAAAAVPDKDRVLGTASPRPARHSHSTGRLGSRWLLPRTRSQVGVWRLRPLHTAKPSIFRSPRSWGRGSKYTTSDSRRLIIRAAAEQGRADGTSTRPPSATSTESYKYRAHVNPPSAQGTAPTRLLGPRALSISINTLCHRRQSAHVFPRRTAWWLVSPVTGPVSRREHEQTPTTLHFVVI